MSKLTKLAVEEHLSKRNYDLKVMDSTSQEQPIPSFAWQFFIAPELQVQLSGIEPIDDDLTFFLILPIPISSTNEVEIFASAVSLALAPVDIIVLPGELALRACARGNRDSLPDLLDELIILTRHVSRTVCLPAVGLADGELTLQQAIESVRGDHPTSENTS